ncbi:YdcF family protein [Vibrio tapetis subsp. quintayensis]|uniref:YdcF family protein n=1 Tax=Vibrio tapetis TaxID=52443 RepID=UPI0025B2E864|nr:YdcF family protein [Vibrio tapetis]MDN3679834.1 YdcF family protein [Vibrio tapetis subsp. quintayensis]
MSLYQNINTLWDYMRLDHQPVKSDCIFCMCSNDIRVAEYAAKLYLDGYASKLVFSGGVGRFTQGIFDTSEAEAFSQIAIDMDVPEQDVILETESTNSGENILFTAALFAQLDYQPTRFILVQKPFMARRAYATFAKQWPRCYQSLVSCSSDLSFGNYFNDILPSDLVVSALLQDFERIRDYPAKGFQIAQEIPAEVIESHAAIKDKLGPFL